MVNKVNVTSLVVVVKLVKVTGFAVLVNEVKMTYSVVVVKSVENDGFGGCGQCG